MKRDSAIDLVKGLAILFVTLGHSIIYHPIHLAALSQWCNHLGKVIESFNMPLFFIISGFLFSKSNKSSVRILKDKVLRLFVPYCFTMGLLFFIKQITPNSMSYNKLSAGGGVEAIVNIFLFGGDRWFVYLLFLVFVVILCIRSFLRTKWLIYSLLLILPIISINVNLPEILLIDRLVYYIFFFLLGFLLCDYYSIFKLIVLKYWHLVYIVFITLNIVFVSYLDKVFFLRDFLLPVTGSIACFLAALQINLCKETVITQYIRWCGRYSLQIYLFSFCYPIIRHLIVITFDISDPMIIVPSVFFMQLLCVTPIIEISKRVNILKIPMGY